MPSLTRELYSTPFSNAVLEHNTVLQTWHQPFFWQTTNQQVQLVRREERTLYNHFMTTECRGVLRTKTLSNETFKRNSQFYFVNMMDV